jgi:hypothetical protein
MLKVLASSLEPWSKAVRRKSNSCGFVDRTFASNG